MAEKEEWQDRGKGHRGRLRDKFIDNGIDGFTDAEIIELLLTFGTPRSDCKLPAKELLTKFGSLAAVFEASPTALMEVKGVGSKNSFALQFIQSVARRYLRCRLKGKRYLTSSNDVREYLSHSMRGLKREVLSVIYLDSSHAIIDSEIVSQGTLNVNAVYPRELVLKALQHNSAAVVIAHNHPSGALKPSPQDDQLTHNLYLACNMMQIRFLDHLIIGDGVYSYADSGKMAAIQKDCEKVLNSLGA